MIDRQKTHCKICNEINENQLYLVREMQLGLRNRFKYFQCSQCKCLQIFEIPTNLNDYYPNNYYSFNKYPLFKKNIISKYVSKKRAEYNLFKNNLFGKILAFIHPNEILKTIGEAGINKNSRVLDVGCGRGHILYAMLIGGMDNLYGIDPYLEENISYSNKLLIENISIEDVKGNFDLIMLNHVFEHIVDQKKMLLEIKSRLSKDGICLIRIPTVSGFAWELYKENWVQIDAPRHIFIHSIESIRSLTKECGFKIEKIKYDSEAFQFIGSEQYLKDIPLNDKRSYLIIKNTQYFQANLLLNTIINQIS